MPENSMTGPAIATLTEVRNYFGMNATEFKNEWTKLTIQDKVDIRRGLASGTENY